MKLFLYGISAAQWWSSARTRGLPSDAFDYRVLADCSPTASSLRYLERLAPCVERPYQLLVPLKRDARKVEGANTHVSAFRYRAGSFVRVASGLYVSCPELCFVQLSSSGTFLDAVRWGYALCGVSAIASDSRSGLVSRPSLTSVAAIGDYLDDSSGLRGLPAARRALAQVRDGSASPRETDLAMRLTLPGRWGGYGIGGAQLNFRIDLGARARSQTSQNYYIADLCWPEKKLVVEYDSDLHLTSSEVAHDAAKRRALEAAGYKVITVTKLQLDSSLEMERIAKAIARHLGIRLRSQASDFERRQRDLFLARK